MKKNMMNSKFGKILRRLIGEESGQALMEYVIIAVLIAAACVVAVIYFGQTTSKQLNAATEGVAANTENSAAQSEKAQKHAKEGTEKSVQHVNRFSPDHKVD